MNAPLTAVSLFAGIGGFDLALHRAGVAVTAAVEIDPACRAVLARHFPQTALFPDVSEVSGDQLRATGFDPRNGILAAGWPCRNAASDSGSHASGGTVRSTWKIGSRPRIAHVDWPTRVPSATPATAAIV